VTHGAIPLVQAEAERPKAIVYPGPLKKHRRERN
jgi:hypothetical protein